MPHPISAKFPTPTIFAVLPNDGRTVAINVGESGCFPIVTRRKLSELNDAAVEPRHVAAAIAGTTAMGWDAPLADPDHPYHQSNAVPSYKTVGAFVLRRPDGELVSDDAGVYPYSSRRAAQAKAAQFARNGEPGYTVEPYEVAVPHTPMPIVSQPSNHVSRKDDASDLCDAAANRRALLQHLGFFGGNDVDGSDAVAYYRAAVYRAAVRETLGISLIPTKPSNRVLSVHLASCGNIDLAQDPDSAFMFAPPNAWVRVIDNDDAADVCRGFIACSDLGGSNWIGGEVRDSTGGVVGNISYNGRFWPKDGTDAETTRVRSPSPR